MKEYFPLMVLVAIVGAGLMSGLFFAFSTSVMRALLQLPPEFGMLAMQRINLVIINPLFLVVFLGTALLCLAIGAICVINASQPGAVWWLAGALAYLVGPFSVTMVFNVPLNNRLASAKSEEAAILFGEMAPVESCSNTTRSSIGTPFGDWSCLTKYVLR
jgi:uncharacterized membrane protein